MYSDIIKIRLIKKQKKVFDYRVPLYPMQDPDPTITFFISGNKKTWKKIAFNNGKISDS